MNIIEKAKLGAAIKRAGKAQRSLQDTWHELAVSAMWHYWKHSDSTFMTQIGNEITLCHGSKKDKMLGYFKDTCKVNWDDKNLRFKKPADDAFTAHSGAEFPMERLVSERWYEFAVDTKEMPSWMLKQALKQLNTQISTHSDEAKDQVIDAWAEYEALKVTMQEVGMGDEGSNDFVDATPEWLVKDLKKVA